ncbi:hypothetical protein [Salipiger thiooxidans]|uniref:hypothetical protein n=1 Tax=Salipiger thiooxidans TaxID=282683 RepID=UPI001CF9D7C4|nr:hypothetical protein [Salipiger thiooxidans]
MEDDDIRRFRRVAGAVRDTGLSHGYGRGPRQLRPGERLRLGAQKLAYRVAPPEAVDHHLATPAGVKLYADGPYLHPAQFGVIAGRGTGTDAGRENVAGLNLMLDYAAAQGLPVVMPHHAVLEIANAVAPLSYPAGIVLNGNGCTIRAQDDDAPVVVASAWLGTAPVGRGARLSDLRIEGTGGAVAGPPDAQHGLVIHGCDGVFEEIVVIRVGGSGILQTEKDRSGSPAAEPLTGNRILRPRILQCAGIGLDIPTGEGAMGRGGVLSDPVVVALAMARTPKIRPVPGARASPVGHAAGGALSFPVRDAPGERTTEVPGWRLPDPFGNDWSVAATLDGDEGRPSMVIAEAGAWSPLTGGEHVHTDLPGASVIFDDAQGVYRVDRHLWHRRQDVRGLVDIDGVRAEWRGGIPAVGAVFCEFVAPAFGGMERHEGLFTIRLAGTAEDGLGGVGAILHRGTGRVGFGLRPEGGDLLYSAGPSFHPGRLHRLFLFYDLVAGEVSVILNGGSVFVGKRLKDWRPVRAQRMMLWENGFVGARSGFSGGARKIQIFDAADLPG